MTLDRVKINEKKTNSSLYFLPFMDEELDLRALDRVENCYLYNNGTDKHFSILYKFSAKLEFIKFENTLMEHELYKGHEDYDEYVLYKFEVPQKLQALMGKVADSNFNNFSDTEKRTIVRFARRRLLPGIELMVQRLDGKFAIADTIMEDETFSDNISRIESKDANELYLEAKAART